jgi:hypothetical protein
MLLQSAQFFFARHVFTGWQVKRISLTKNIIKVLENNADIPALELYPRSHQVLQFSAFIAG